MKCIVFFALLGLVALVASAPANSTDVAAPENKPTDVAAPEIKSADAAAPEIKLTEEAVNEDKTDNRDKRHFIKFRHYSSYEPAVRVYQTPTFIQPVHVVPTPVHHLVPIQPVVIQTPTVHHFDEVRHEVDHHVDHINIDHDDHTHHYDIHHFEPKVVRKSGFVIAK